MEGACRKVDVGYNWLITKQIQLGKKNDSQQNVRFHVSLIFLLCFTIFYRLWKKWKKKMDVVYQIFLVYVSSV